MVSRLVGTGPKDVMERVGVHLGGTSYPIAPSQVSVAYLFHKHRAYPDDIY